MFGIEDDGKYNHPVEIRIIGEGNAYLDGVEIFGGAVVCENGIHNLTVKSGNGELTKEYFFTVNFNKAHVFKTDYSNGTAAVDETNGFACIYGDSLVGVRIYDLNDLDYAALSQYLFNKKPFIDPKGNIQDVFIKNMLDSEKKALTKRDVCGIIKPEQMFSFSSEIST